MLDDAGSTTDPTDDATHGAIDSLFRCSICGAPYVPRNRRHTATCGAIECQHRRIWLAQKSSPEKQAKARERERRALEAHSAYYTARTTLRRRGLLTSETAAALLPLRGQGRMPLHDALARCGLGALLPTPALPAVATNVKTRRTILVAPSTVDAWALPSPALDRHLVTAASLRLTQRGIPRRRVRDHGGARLLHGALHRALNIGHDLDKTPLWLALPTERSGALWLLVAPQHESILALPSEPSSGPRLPASVHLGTDDAPHELAIVARTRIKAPAPRAPGQYRARVIAAGPLVIKKSNRLIAKRDRALPYLHQLQTNPTSLDGVIERVAARVGLQIRAEQIIARVIAHDLDEIEGGVRVGGHWRSGARGGVVECMVGTIDVECNAVGRWLLDCAALVSLGGKVALGFGRVRVEDL